MAKWPVSRRSTRHVSRYAPYVAAGGQLVRRAFHYGRAAYNAYHAGRHVYNRGKQFVNKARSAYNRVFGPKSKAGVHTQNDGFHNNRFTYRYGKRRRIKTLTAPIMRYINTGGDISSQAGRQLMQTLIYLYDNTDLAALDAQLPSSSDHQQNMILRGAKMQIHLSCAHQNPAKVKLYHLLCKNDNADNPTTEVQAGIDDQTGATNGHLFPDMSPMRSQKFRNNWVIKKVQSKWMAPGTGWDITINAKANVRLNEERWRERTNISGLTYALMVVVQGGIVTEQGASGDVSVGVTRLSFYATKSFTTTYIERIRESGSAVNSLDQSISVAVGIPYEEGDVEPLDPAV